MSGEMFALQAGSGWFHSFRDGGDLTSERVIGWLVLADGRRPRAIPITRGDHEGIVWCDGDVDVPEGVRVALGLQADEAESWTRPNSRWPE